MKILTPKEMATADETTFAEFALPSRVVMEVAGRKVVSFLLSAYAQELSNGVLVLCGGGNNGGDGFVVARALYLLGVPVRAACIKPLAELKDDCLANCESFQKCGGVVTELTEDSWHSELPGLSSCGVMVDAVFGTGFHGAPEKFPSELFAFLNAESQARPLPVVAIDIPSGVDAATGEVPGEVLQASATVCLQSLKVGHVLFPGSAYCGEVFLC